MSRHSGSPTRGERSSVKIVLERDINVPDQPKDQLIDRNTYDSDNEEEVEVITPQRSTPRLLAWQIIAGIIVLLVIILLFTFFGVTTLMQHPPLQDSTGALPHITII
jgi:hypothetical protein